MLLTLVEFAGTAEDMFTVIATSVMHDAPDTPHALTCSVWPPAAAQTDVVIDVAFKIVVSVLLSSEYPIALTCWPEQSDVYAERLNGELTTLP